MGHVQRHHIETSIIPIDYDTMYPVKRVLSSYKPLWFHKYQHVYMWLLYPITMFAWTVGDLVYAFHPRVPLDAKMKSLSISTFFMLHAWVMPFFCQPAATAAWFVMLEIWVSSIFFSMQFVVSNSLLLAGLVNHVHASNVSPDQPYPGALTWIGLLCR